MTRKPLPRRDFIKVVGSTALAGSVLRAQGAGPTTSPTSNLAKPNVVLIVADDQRADTLGALGNSHIQTPMLDTLVRDGFVFTQARCMGSTQGAVCIPSRACLHSGRMLFTVPDDIGHFETLGQTLRSAGYNAGAFGKWHNGAASFTRSFNTGGHIFFGGMTDQFHVRVHNYAPSGKYDAGEIVAGKFSTELFTDAAVDFIAGQKSTDKPFFCYLAITSPHDPRTSPAPFDKMYDPAKMPLPANFLPEPVIDTGELKIRDELLAPFPRTPDNTRQQLCDYYGMISSQDAQVGRVLTALKDAGQWENTIIVYTGDHGLAIGSHGFFGKQNVYEPSARIPCMIAGPGVPRGKRSDALVYGFDLFPTLCEMLQVQSPQSVEGKSLARIVSGQDNSVRDSSFHAYIKKNDKRAADTQHAVRDERWKMISFDVNGHRRLQLFDLQNDPAEMNDLSSDAAASRELPRLSALLARWQKETAEPDFG